MEAHLLNPYEPTDAEHREALEVLAEQRERRIADWVERIGNDERLLAEALDGEETRYLVDLLKGGDPLHSVLRLTGFMERKIEKYARECEENNQ